VRVHDDAHALLVGRCVQDEAPLVDAIADGYHHLILEVRVAMRLVLVADTQLVVQEKLLPPTTQPRKVEAESGGER
jgi:hypothetical protein